MAPNSEYLLGVMDGKLDQVIKNQDLHNQLIRESLVKHGDRINSLEGSHHKLVGAAAVIAALTSAAWQWVTGK